MITSISRTLAQQIVDTIYDVCGYNINFISPEGNIYASTNPERIGTFHEIGQKAARTGETIEVAEGETYAGTQAGINIPIYYHHTVIAVIGITAEPAEARRYAHLAERVTTMLLHEQEQGEHHRSMDEQKLYLIRCLQSGTFDNHDYFDECLRQFHVDRTQPYRMICIQVSTRYNLVNISLLEQRVQTLFESMQQEVFSYIYPNQFAGTISEAAFEKNKFMLQRFARAHQHIVKTAVGSAAPLARCKESWENALTALASIAQKDDEDIVLFDDLDLEILLSGIPAHSRNEFRQKIMGNLSEEDIHFLKTYYEEDMSLKQTAEKLFLHKNTVQQRLLRIANKTGRDPRKLQDAVLFYLAGQV